MCVCVCVLVCVCVMVSEGLQHIFLWQTELTTAHYTHNVLTKTLIVISHVYGNEGKQRKRHMVSTQAGVRVLRSLE